MSSDLLCVLLCASLWLILPTVIRGMAGLDCDEGAATSGADFVVRDQLAFDDRFVASRLNYTRDEFHWTIARRRAQELDRVLSSDGARRLIGAALLHQVPCR